MPTLPDEDYFYIQPSPNRPAVHTTDQILLYMILGQLRVLNARLERLEDREAKATQDFGKSPRDGGEP